MKRSMMALAASLLALGTTGCASLVPFTHEIRVQHDLSDDDVSRLQFYTSHEIKLRREVKTQGRRIDDGALRLRSGTRIEEVVVPAHTPGVVVAVEGHAIEVSFSRGSSMRFVVGDAPQPLSGPLRKEPPRIGFATPPEAFPADDEVRDPLAEAIGNYFVSIDSGQLPFRGVLWEAEDDTVQAHLLIDADTLEEVVEEQTTLGGRRL